MVRRKTYNPETAYDGAADAPTFTEADFIALYGGQENWNRIKAKRMKLAEESIAAAKAAKQAIQPSRKPQKGRRSK